MSHTIIRIENATVRYNMVSEKIDNMKEYFVKFVKRQLNFKEFLALKNINFEVKKGESWGIIGANGAGKSTLLKLICNIIEPSKGWVTVNGNISPMIELGSGFDPNLTGEENVYLQGAILGYSKKFMEEKYKDILEFSELGEFMNIPVKNYSSGMQGRLAFSIATVVKPEILIVDEVLGVGDASFQKKCQTRINNMINEAATLLLVAHSDDTIKELCKNAIWLHKGEVAMMGKSAEVCDEYMSFITHNN